MPKKACCCVLPGNFIAIPCRYYGGRVFSAGINVSSTFTWAHYDSGTPEQIGGFGGGQGALLGPFRVLNNERVFDTTRDVLYMMRGAGGGGSGVTLPDEIYVKGSGGNGAYTEYKKKAALTDVVKAGKGGLGGPVNYNSGTAPESTNKSGGQALSNNAFGGDAAGIGEWNSSNNTFNAFSSAGAGGGAAVGLGQLNTGARSGGHAGITHGMTGENGYENIGDNPGPTGGGGGASQTQGGRSITTDFNLTTRALPGTIRGGGRGQRYRPSNVPASFGHGGGGGAGKYGGGGGYEGGGGGGGSSDIAENYSFDPSDTLSANYCNPYLSSSSGMGGFRGSLNTSSSGTSAQIAQYYILKYCECDPSKNTFPEKMFICLNRTQYDTLVGTAGDLPSTCNNNCKILFKYDDEEYILLGECDSECEPIYRIPSDATITDIRWEVPEVILGEGTSTFSRAPCCNQTVCRPVCPVQGANCATCGCPFESKPIYVCCDTTGKPTSYLSIYNGWIYSCKTTNDGWIDPGETSQVERLCMDPVDDLSCDNNTTNCTYTIPETPWDRCLWYAPDPTYCDFEISAQSGSFTSYFTNFCWTQGSGQDFCLSQMLNVSGSIIFSTLRDNCGLYGETQGPPKQGCLAPPPGTLESPYLYTLSACMGFIQDRVEEENLLEIQFDCVPPQNSFGGYPVSIPGGNGSGEWIICGARVNVISCTLEELVDALNLRLSPRVIVTGLASNRHLGGSFPDLISDIVATITNNRLKLTVKTFHTYVRACGQLTAKINFGAFCGAFPGTTQVKSAFIGRPVSSWDITSGNLGITICPCQDNQSKCTPDSCYSDCTSDVQFTSASG